MISREFQNKSAVINETAKPFSIRLTFEERAFLEKKAGRMPLSTYIRSRLLEKAAKPRKTSGKPKINDAALARVLAALGQSGLSSNIAKLAEAVNAGQLVANPQLERDLMLACEAIQDVRRETIKALGLRSRNDFGR